MSASRTKKERQMQAQAGMTPKQKEAAAKEKATRLRTKIYIIAGIVAAILIAALLFWDSGVIQRRATALTVGDRSYTAVDLDYYYYSTYSSYSSYASIYGLDSNTNLKKQELYDGYTWHDMLMESAQESLTSVSIVCQEAEKAGYTLSEAGKETVANTITQFNSSASLYGTTADALLKSNYGKYMTEKDFERILTDQQLYQEYIEVYRDGVDVTDADIDGYYTEHADTLDTLEYDCYLVKVATTSTDADGNSVDLSDEEIDANRTEAAKQADELKTALESGDDVSALAEEYDAQDYSNATYYSNLVYGDWLLDSARKDGDCTVVENTDSDGNVIGYYAVRLNARYLDEYYPVSVRSIRFAATQGDDGTYDMSAAQMSAQLVLQSWQSEGATEDAFAALADTNSSDTSTYPGGLHESVNKKTYPESVTNWLFSDERAAGDYTMIADEDGHAYYVLYYVGHDDVLYCRSRADAALRTEAYTNWLTDLKDNSYTVATGSGLNYVG